MANGNVAMHAGTGADELTVCLQVCAAALNGEGGGDILIAGSARDGALDLVRGQEGFDRARVDTRLDNVRGVEFLVCPRGCR